MIKKNKLWSLVWSLALAGFLMAFSCDGMAAVSPAVFGVDFLEPKSPTVLGHLTKWGIHTAPSWGKNKVVFEDGQEFEGMPPREFLRKHCQLSNYRVIVLDTKEDLRAYVAYRLLQKYNEHDEEMQITSLPQIKTLLDSPRFMEQFINFLHLQLTMIILTDLENNIVDASREKEDLAPDGSRYPVTLPKTLRAANGQFLKKIGNEADLAWEEVISLRRHILSTH